jgi:glycosyltransferase involved in cell wall biosynthesis
VVRRLAASADVVVGFDMPSVAYLAAAAAVRGSGRRPRIACDLIDDPWLLRKSIPRGRRWSVAFIKSALAMQVVRRRVLPRFDALIAVAPQDAANLSRATGLPTEVVPNGTEVESPAAGSETREPLVVFTGSMSFPANVAAARFMARQVWPLVLASRQYGLGPDTTGGGSRQATLAIVGADPVPAVQELATLPNIVVTGRVPSIREWLGRARVAVAPMLGGTGIKNKILEACAAGCPVVATPMAIGGLPTGEEAGIIVADGPERIAAEVFRLLADTTAARRIGSAGLEMARTHFSWTRIAAAFLEILRGDAPPRSGGEGTSSTQSVTGEQQVARDEEAPAHAAP